MDIRIHKWLWKRLTTWLAYESTGTTEHLSDFGRLQYEIRPADVLLVEGRSHVSDIIKIITLSAWTHAGLYIGRLHDIEAPATRRYVLDAMDYDPDPGEPMIIEAVLGEGSRWSIACLVMRAIIFVSAGPKDFPGRTP